MDYDKEHYSFSQSFPPALNSTRKETQENTES